MIKTATLLLAFYLVSSHGISHFELEDQGAYCQSYNCESLKGDSKDHLWADRACECGMHCTLHNTCCIDSPHVAECSRPLHHGETCNKLSTFSSAVVLVNKCSGRWRHEHFIREKCEGLELYTEDPVMAAPVTSLITNITYRNSFCALCNYDDPNDSVVWNIRLELSKKRSPSGSPAVAKEDFLEYPFYDKAEKSWGVLKDHVFHGLKMQHILPPDLKKLVKKCYPEMIAHCDPLQPVSDGMQHRCQSYYAPIKIMTDPEYGEGETYYRNIHCAMCNGVDVSQVEGTNICIRFPGVRKRPSFSFDLLLDVSRSDGDLVGKKQLCEGDEKWDPFFKKCRSLVCVLPGHVVKEGKCVQG